VDETHNFYSQYAYEVGFLFKKYRELKNCKWLNCSMEGKNTERGVGNPRMRNTCSKQTQGKAGMKLKIFYDDAKVNVISVRIDLVNFDHNHEFLKKDIVGGLRLSKVLKNMI
jgi:hypothetical protein